MEYNIVYRLLVALLLGFFIGLERSVFHDRDENKENPTPSLGIRTFALTTTLGAIAGFLYSSNQVLFAFICIALLALTIGYYIFDSVQSKDYGITTELSLIYCFVIGVLIASEIFPLQLVIVITIVLALLLSNKDKINKLFGAIQEHELASFISYTVIALVILPLLPNTSFTVGDIPLLSDIAQSFSIDLSRFAGVTLLNPYSLWLVIALVTGVDVLGYVLEKVVGKSKGWLLTSLVGGYISSTATTQSLAQQSKRSSSINYLVGAAIIANLASFISHATLLAPLNFALFLKSLLVIFFMLITSSLITFFFIRSNDKNKDTDLPVTNESLQKTQLFSLSSALKFAVILLVIKIASEIALILFGSIGFLISIAFGAVVGMDPIIVSLAEMAGKTVTLQFALMAFILGNTVNLLTKSFYSFFVGKREFSVKFFASSVLIIISGLIGFLLA